MAAVLSSVLLLALSGFIAVTEAGPEQGRWNFDVTLDQNDQNEKTFAFHKSIFNKSHIGLSIVCDGSESVTIKIEWLVRHSPCANEYTDISEEQAKAYLRIGGFELKDPMPYKVAKYLKNYTTINCSKDLQQIIPPFIYGTPQVAVYEVKTPKPTIQEDEKSKDTSKSSDKSGNKEKKREEIDNKRQPKERRKRAINSKEENKTDVKPELEQKGKLVKVWDDGYYLFVIHFTAEKKPVPKDFKMHVTVEMSYGNSYLSAVEWPLLIFYGIMGLVYIFYGIFWLVMLACNWRDLLRVQFWIGAVIFLGMLEKAVFFGEYENINTTGQSVQGAIVVAELVSCLKRTLARMLVLIVSLGYGIVKPRLGQTFHKVLFVGVVFFILASIESCSRALSSRADQSVKLLVAGIPLAVTDAIICWWVKNICDDLVAVVIKLSGLCPTDVKFQIFSSLLQTTRTLRLRRNVVKLSLYRHFTNTLIFAVLASVAYMIWFTTQHRLKECITDWRELWIDDAFWHLLFSVILFVIMILWRPSANNQRYAFSPLLDAADDDFDDEQTLNEAYEGMKMRTTNSQQRNGSPRVKDDSKVEDDLKWVEDNIPSSLADRVLPALDSDEEIMNAKFESSKME